MRLTRLLGYLVLVALVVAALIASWPIMGRSALARAGAEPVSGRAESARVRVLPGLRARLAPLGLAVGNDVFIRIFKQERMLELWMRPPVGAQFLLAGNYPICAFSGALGPKTRQGDGQAPEGFYSVRRGQLNPASSYHLAFNLGYPNAYERAQGWTGNYLMVHGNCVSIGCYAMGDAAIEEIYTLIDAALVGGQASIPVHAFPFRFDAAHERLRQASPHAEFWAQLAEGYRAFERDRVPPIVSLKGGRYWLQ